MEKNLKNILTTKEAAKELNVETSTIHNYVKEGKIRPIYNEDWQIDATKLFYKEDILRLKKALTKPGITTGDAAKLLGLHMTTVSQYIQKGLLKAEKKIYRGRNIYFIEPEELERFKCEYVLKKKKEKKDFFDKNTGYAWFQTFIDLDGNSSNRILPDESGEPFLFTKDGKKIPLYDIESKGYRPIFIIPDVDYIYKKGYAHFRFEENNIFYEIIPLFYRSLGSKNMKITIGQNLEVFIDVKPTLISGNENTYEILKTNLLEGKVNLRHDGIYIDSDLEIITIAAPSQLKNRIKKDAIKLGITMEELVLKILNEKYSN